jgi:hypothetical protein
VLIDAGSQDPHGASPSVLEKTTFGVALILSPNGLSSPSTSGQ